MQLPLQTFTSLVERMAASVQGASRALLDLSVGSVLRALLEASASAALWMQWLILQVLAMTRAATSTGADLDSWMADFSLTRLPAAPAAAVVTFSRVTPGMAALIPAGTLVRTADGTQSFAVQGASGSAWNAASGGYVVPAVGASIDLPVLAVTPGAAGNVQAGAISLLAAAIPGIDAVSNAAAASGGMDAEGDAALRARFLAYINSRSRATPGAVGYAVASVRQGLRYAIAENQDPTGAALPGSFVVTVDDGTGTPGSDLLAAAQAAVEAVRPVGSVASVLPPVVVPVGVSMLLTLAGGADAGAAQAAVTQAVQGFVAGLPVGGVLSVSRVASLAYAASPAVQNVGNMLLNGAAADVSPGPRGVVILSGVAFG